MWGYRLVLVTKRREVMMVEREEGKGAVPRICTSRWGWAPRGAPAPYMGTSPYGVHN